MLTDDERRLFRRLSVFAGGWTLDAAERICAPDDSAGDEVLDLLTRLVDKSMVVAEGGASGVERYRLLETLRQYGQERLAESGEGDAIRDRHFAYYLALVKTAHTEVAVPRQRDGWLQRLDDDNDNLRTALTWGSERDPRAALRMAVDLSWYWWYRRRYPEGVGWQERLLDSAPGDTQLQARALAHIGLLAREYGDVERAQFAAVRSQGTLRCARRSPRASARSVDPHVPVPRPGEAGRRSVRCPRVFAPEPGAWRPRTAGVWSGPDGFGRHRSKRISSPREAGTSRHCGSLVPWTTGSASCGCAYLLGGVRRLLGDYAGGGGIIRGGGATA